MAQQQQGSGFSNIQNILSANQGNKLGSAVGGGVQAVSKEAQQGLQNSQQDFQNQTQQGLTNLGNEKTIEQNVLQNPTNATDQDVANFATYRGGQYGGPTTLSNADQLHNKAQEAEQLGQAGQTQAGRLGLLQRFASGGNQYSSGQQNLDNLLLGQSANNNLAAARRTTFGLGNKVNQAAQNAQNTAQTVQGQYQNFANQTNQDIQNQQNPVMAQLSTAATSAQAAKDARAAQIQQELQSGNISTDDAKLLGLQAGQDIGNLDLNRFLTVDPTKANAQNVANAQQTAQLNALARLGGQNAFNANPDQAGTFGNNQFTYDTSGLQQAAAQNQANFQNASQTARNLANQAQQTGSGFLSGLTGWQGINPNMLGIGQADVGLAALGINPTDPNAFNKLATVYQQTLNNQYTGQGSGAGELAQGGGNAGKAIQEGVFGKLDADKRAQIIDALNQYNTNQQQINQLTGQYGIGRTLAVNPGASTNTPMINQILTNPNS